MGLRLSNSPTVPASLPILPPFFKYSNVLIVKYPITLFLISGIS